MAGLEGATRATVETWLGPIEQGQNVGQLEDLQVRYARLALPELVALEILMLRRAELSLAPTSFSADDVRIDHKANLAFIGDLIEKLVSRVRADDTISLTIEQEKLVAGAETPDDPPTRIIGVSAPNRRRG